MTTDTEVMVDTTVQENNITFPTDVKLYRKIIARYHKVARDETIHIRRGLAYENPRKTGSKAPEIKNKKLFSGFTRQQ